MPDAVRPTNGRFHYRRGTPLAVPPASFVGGYISQVGLYYCLFQVTWPRDIFTKKKYQTPIAHISTCRRNLMKSIPFDSDEPQEVT